MTTATPRGVFAVAVLLSTFITNAFAQEANSARSPHTQLLRARELARVLRQSPPSSSFNKTALPNRLHGGADPAMAGIVTSSDGSLLENAIVIAFTPDSSVTPWKGFAFSQADGSYLITPLVAGEYYVYAEARDHLQQFFDHTASYFDAKLVQVNEADTTTGIDFTLEKNTPGTGAISGKVTEAGSVLPVANAAITVYSIDAPYYYGSASVQHDGTYRVEGLKSGNYIVQAWAEDFIPLFYKQARAIDQATAVAVNEPSETTGIDFAMSRGAIIMGKVTDDVGAPLQGAMIEAFPTTEDSATLGNRGYAISGSDGTYQINGLTSGKYLALAQAWNQWSYDIEWYHEADDLTLADTLAVNEGETVRDIDFTLSLAKAAGSIAGRVTNAQGEPIANAVVQTQNWAAPGDSTKPVYWGYAYTDAAGYYRIEMPAGEYWIAAYAFSSWQYAVQWYDHVSTQDSAQTLVIAQDVHHTNIDFALPLVAGTSTIAGRILSNESAPLPYSFVMLTSDNTSNPSVSVWAYGNADSNGYYAIAQLPPGNYIAQAQAWQGDKFGRQWYQNADSVQDATIIALGVDEKISNIDFTLTLRPIYGKLFGQVASDSGGIPIARAYVELTPQNRDYQRGAPFAFWGLNTITDDNGNYRFEWIPEGEYLISVHAQGAFEYHENAVVAEQATVLNLIGGDSLQINFGLTPRHEGNGAITGRVLQEYSNAAFPIAIVTARPVVTPQLWPQSEMFFTNEDRQPLASTKTNAEGMYEITSLTPGKYRMLASHLAFEGKYNDNANDFASAQPLEIGRSKLEVNFTLVPKGTTGVEEQPNTTLPKTAALHGNYPNPFNPETSVQFSVSSEQLVSLKVYDVTGNEVATLVHEKKPAGIYNVRFAANGLASGVYFIKLRAGAFVATRKIALVR